MAKPLGERLRELANEAERISGEAYVDQMEWATETFRLRHAIKQGPCLRCGGGYVEVMGYQGEECQMHIARGTCWKEKVLKKQDDPPLYSERLADEEGL